jgi:hypothetical protein
MQGDPSWMHILLAVHIAAGGLCLVLAPLVLAVTKGGRSHRRWGKIYFLSMGVLAATALPMALFRPVLFLALIAVLSFYLVFSGYRVLRLKDLADGGSAGAIDWAAAILAFAACACLSVFALLRPAWVQHMGIVAVVLGAIGMRAAAGDIWRFAAKPKDKLFWMYAHLEKFMGSYIAVWTAFSVATLSRIFPQAGIALWLWPAAVGVPVIVATAAWFRFKNGAAARRTIAAART